MGKRGSQVRKIGSLYVSTPLTRLKVKRRLMRQPNSSDRQWKSVRNRKLPLVDTGTFDEQRYSAVALTHSNSQGGAVMHGALMAVSLEVCHLGP
jgi:Na+(H+)/acetate symporter ActP